MLLKFDSVTKFIEDVIEAIAEDDTFLDSGKCADSDSPRAKYKKEMEERIVSRAIAFLKCEDKSFRNIVHSPFNQNYIAKNALKTKKAFRELVISTMGTLDVPRRFDAIMDASRRE